MQTYIHAHITHTHDTTHTHTQRRSSMPLREQLYTPEWIGLLLFFNVQLLTSTFFLTAVGDQLQCVVCGCGGRCWDSKCLHDCTPELVHRGKLKLLWVICMHACCIRGVCLCVYVYACLFCVRPVPVYIFMYAVFVVCTSVYVYVCVFLSGVVVGAQKLYIIITYVEIMHTGLLQTLDNSLVRVRMYLYVCSFIFLCPNATFHVYTLAWLHKHHIICIYIYISLLSRLRGFEISS